MPAPQKYFIVDAFANRPFAGNPAAVVPLDTAPLETWPNAAWLQNVAAEMNLSETAFLVPNDQGYDLRWFTPTVEVDLCGHATLASAVVLSHLGKLADAATVEFSTRSGILKASRRGQRFELDFPITPAQAAEAPSELLSALNVQPKSVGRSKFDFLVELESETAVRNVKPDFKQLATVDCRGIIVTATSDDKKFDFVSRFFGPASGIDEDPVTGSAHCCLAEFWGRRLGKTNLVGYQASARGGVVYTEVRGDRVLLGGEAVLVAQGELLV